MEMFDHDISKNDNANALNHLKGEFFKFDPKKVPEYVHDPDKYGCCVVTKWNVSGISSDDWGTFKVGISFVFFPLKCFLHQ